MANGDRPAAEFRIGYVKAVVWQNGEFYNVEVSRSYKKDNEWRDGSSFGHTDLLNAIQVLKRAEDFIANQG